ncbi:hypothetical protein A244_38575 [Pseudomonas syringae pv. actinidiae ICMP 18807]|uniref:Knr4/Smi1-like domain-containing protein n=2 Tax=Pseudomonas syringae TaxID=317 RepID=S6SMT0_PSESF|nr:hypothetical protein A244_38575 [Pseudomonas syringae pv. actinidiae ICMP 18807]
MVKIIMATLINKEQQLTDIDIDSFEKLFVNKIPTSFKTHYKANNGGTPSESDMEKGLWGLPICGFYSIKYGKLKIENTITDIEFIDPEEKKYGTWAEYEFLPFAYDSGGNPIFLSLREEDYGHIYLYAPDGKNIFSISDDFEDFLKRLYQPQLSE